MTLRREVLDALEDMPEGLCDACLRKDLSATSHQHVNATCRNLELEGRLLREKTRTGECSACGKVRVINRLTTSASRKTTNSTTTTTAPSACIGINELDALRREIIQLLNHLDPEGTRDGFSKRVSMLRNNQLIPSQIAALMLTHATYRNELYYNAYSLSEDEQAALEAIDKCLRSYLTNTKLQTTT